MLTKLAKTYNMPMLICNRFHEKLANIRKNSDFYGDTALMPSCAGFL